MKITFGKVVNYGLIALFLAYILHSVVTLYDLFYPPQCTNSNKRKCIGPYLAKNPKLELNIYTSVKKNDASSKHKKLLWSIDNFTIGETFERDINVSLPTKTVNNGTLYAYVYVSPRGQVPFQNQLSSVQMTSLTVYTVPQTQYINLIGGADEEKVNKSRIIEKPVTHWKPALKIGVVSDLQTFDRYSVPKDVYGYLRTTPEGDYLPLLYVDEISSRLKDLKEVKSNMTEMALHIEYKPMSIGKLRLYTTMQESLKTLQSLGFTEKDTDDVKGIFVDTSFYLLALTFFVSACHLLFDFLAFKNDISFWRGRDSMIGLSTRTVVWRAVSQIIIFFYLMDEQTSMLVLVPAGIGTIIESWKVTKAFKVHIKWSGVIPRIEFGAVQDSEKETQEYDSTAMQYLSYILYPLCLGGAVYSLMYVSHRSWYSWVISSLVNGVYAFGFLFMLPQLFVNYKLKSVAHLPWRAFMYKAFNTFIDDVFAFIITMPTAHRIACFRDDFVFVIYLYQRWLYPVDKKRVNEFGMSYEDDKDKTPSKEHQD
ncbi:lipid scramblase CLPTM1L-like [Ptychodera flava]|uniref:lipid scramblase CLPTM1L-like n=1 Tax=Ptychodera flava TaxID=63121 RepID=UPI00396A752C